MNQFFSFFLSLYVVIRSKELEPVPHQYLQNCSKKSDCGQLICSNNTCVSCFDYPSCQDINYNCFADNFTTKNGSVLMLRVCDQKELFAPITGWEILAAGLAFLGGCLASSGGIGGGGIFIPTLILVAQYEPKKSSVVAASMILGVYTNLLFWNFWKKHPSKPWSLVNFDVVAYYEPTLLLGTTVGVLLNKVFPNWLILILLFVTLSFSLYKTLRKGITGAINERKNNDGRMTVIDDTPIVVEKEHTTELRIGIGRKSLVEDDYNAIHDRLIEKPGNITFKGVVDKVLYFSEKQNLHESAETPLLFEPKPENVIEKRYSVIIHVVENLRKCRIQYIQLIFIAFTWIVVFLITIFKGSSKVNSVLDIPYCGSWYWVLFGINFPTIFGPTLAFGVILYVFNFYLGKKTNDTEVLVWNFKRSFLFPPFLFITGIACGTIGIGGGMLVSPILMEFLPNQVVMATTSVMGLFTTSSTVLQYLIGGSLRWTYTIFFGSLGFLSSFVGQLVLNIIIRRFKKAYVIAFFVSGTVFVSLVLLLIVSVRSIIIDLINRDYERIYFHNPCAV